MKTPQALKLQPAFNEHTFFLKRVQIYNLILKSRTENKWFLLWNSMTIEYVKVTKKIPVPEVLQEIIPDQGTYPKIRRNAWSRLLKSV